MVILESIPAALAARSFAPSHLLPLFPHSSGDHVNAGPRSALKDDAFPINRFFAPGPLAHRPPSEFILSLQNLWLLQGNPAADRSRDAEEGGEGEMGGGTGGVNLVHVGQTCDPTSPFGQPTIGQ